MSRALASVRILILYPNIRKKGLTKKWFVEKNGTNAGHSLLQVGEVSGICEKKMEEMKCPKNLQLWYKNRCTSEMRWQYSKQALKKYCKMTTAKPKQSPHECLTETFQEQTLLGHYFEYKKESSTVACHGITEWIIQPKVLMAQKAIKSFSDGEAMDLDLDDFDTLGFWRLKE